MTVHIFAYDADGRDDEIALDDLDPSAFGEHKLVWIDVSDGDRTALETISERLGVEAEPFLAVLGDVENVPQNFGTFLRFSVDAAPLPEDFSTGSVKPDRVTENRPKLDKRVVFFFSEQWLVTVHDDRVDFLNQFREQDQSDTLIGLLSPLALAASLLDWHLGEFFEDVSKIAADVDALDERVLRENASSTLLGRIVTLRRRTSRLRELLVRNRLVFYGLSRPDLILIANSDSVANYQLLATRFERALDEVERVRDLISGSFDLFSSRNGIETNALVKVLTIVTAVFGYFGATAGIFGMNVKATVFEGGDLTFAIIVGTVFVTSVLAIVIARTKKWI
ncbi:MAG: hypothetical protein H0X36_04145 [Sphingomonadaceae bacterium]|nr:hypothetical protein [Sphingomonadaceae bacterium]